METISNGRTLTTLSAFDIAWNKWVSDLGRPPTRYEETIFRRGYWEGLHDGRSASAAPSEARTDTPA